MLDKIIITLISFCLFAINILLAQENNYVIIDGFEINGNKKTKESIIIREMDMQIGDTISLDVLPLRFGKNQTLLLNTGLFYEVDLNVKEWNFDNYHVTILIDVREAWYIYPIPIFELADRNFNVWWTQFNRSLKRVNYGVNLYYANVSGRQDYLKSVFQLGFTQKFELEYAIPYINKNQTIGLNTNFLFTRNKEVPYTTTENDLVFYRDDNQFLFKRYRYGGGLTYKPHLYEKHQIESNYYHRVIQDTLYQLNPDFFMNNRKKQRFFSLEYSYTLDKRNMRVMPTKGFYLNGTVNKEGFGIFKDRNALIFSAQYAQYIPLGKKKKYILSLNTKAQTQAIRQQMPYYNNKALGYFNDYVRGYEYYVIDGLDYVYNKTSIHYELLNKTIDWKKAMPLSAFKIMPIRLYLSINSDVAYVNEPYYYKENPLSNEFLYGFGVGVDLVIYIDKMIQVEYTINHLGEAGVYLHYSLTF